MNPSAKSLIPLTEELSKRQYNAGEKLDIIIDKLITSIQESLSWELMSSQFGLQSRTKTNRFSLLQFCGEKLIKATQKTLFDPVLFEIDPEMTQSMITFNDELWKLMNPSWLVNSQRVKVLRQKYIDAFIAYIRLPSSARRQESWLVSSVIEQHKSFNISEKDSAAMLVMVYWT